MGEDAATNRWRRYDAWDERPLHLDRLAAEDPENGFCAANSPFDPTPTLRFADGEVVELDGRLAADFDLIDAFIARHHLDLGIAADAMALEAACSRTGWSTSTSRGADASATPRA